MVGGGDAQRSSFRCVWGGVGRQGAGHFIVGGWGVGVGGGGRGVKVQFLFVVFLSGGGGEMYGKGVICESLHRATPQPGAVVPTAPAPPIPSHPICPQCLTQGCRVIELDVYNKQSGYDGPVCKHGGTMTKPVLFKVRRTAKNRHK